METFVIQMTKDEFKSVLKDAIHEALTEKAYDNKNENTLINIQEAAALLNLAVATLYEKTSEKTIPHYKHGKKIVFKKSELIAWVEASRVATVRGKRSNSLRLQMNIDKRTK